VWVLSSDERAVARLDPETKAVTKRIRVRGLPVDIAAGGGAVWVGTGSTLARVDPRTGRTTKSIRLPEKHEPGDLSFSSWGFPQIAVAPGAVWAINPDRTVSRIDPASGRRVATVEVDAATIAAGAEGVWFIDGDDTRTVVRIDPRRNRVAQRVEVGAQLLNGLAVGGGSVWASAEGDGVVWRIEPGPDPVQRTIDVGIGVTYVAFGAGAAWAGNYVDGKVSRIDPRTNEVTATSVGAVQGLAAGAGSVWAPTAGAATAGAFPEPGCREPASRVSDPDVVIAADLPLQGEQAPLSRSMAGAMEFVLGRNGFRAGRHTVGFRLCDDSTAQVGVFDRRRCAANAQAYSRVDRLVAVIGPLNSDCARIEIPILNRAPGGPVAMISPSNTDPGLTRTGQPPPWGYRDEPDVFYPTGERHYVRVVPPDDTHGPAQALLARQLGLGSVYVLYDSTTFWKGYLADPFRYAARRIGVDVAGFEGVDPEDLDADAIAERVAHSGADGVLLGLDPYVGGDTIVKELRARLGRRATLMGGFYFAFAPDMFELIGPAARGIYAATSDLPRSVLERTPAAERFLSEFGGSDAVPFVLESAQATELVLRAIARSDGTRASVLEQLRASRVENGILGSFRFDNNGDITPASVPILRLTGSTPPSARLPTEFQGAVVDRVVDIPRRLLR
jgi:branched-chain amino acid transport system substrate-binding protein